MIFAIQAQTLSMPATLPRSGRYPNSMYLLSFENRFSRLVGSKSPGKITENQPSGSIKTFSSEPGVGTMISSGLIEAVAHRVCDYTSVARLAESWVSVLFMIVFIDSSLIAGLIQPAIERTSEAKIAIETIRKTLMYRFFPIQSIEAA